MADEFYRGFKASGNLSNQYSLVKQVDEGTVEQAGANEKAMGIIQGTASDGETVNVKLAGISKLEFNEASAIGKYVTSTASGTGEIVDNAGEHAIGITYRAAEAQGDIGKVLISPFTAHASDA